MSDEVIPDSLKHIAYGNDSVLHQQREAVLNAMQRDVYTNNVAHGWFDTDRTFGDEISLLHEEVSEMLKAWRQHGFDDFTKYVAYGKGDRGEDLPIENPKPESVAIEAADVLIRLLDTCERHDINLAEAFRVKMNYNLTRPYRHGGRRI